MTFRPLQEMDLKPKRYANPNDPAFTKGTGIGIAPCNAATYEGSLPKALFNWIAASLHNRKSVRWTFSFQGFLEQGEVEALIRKLSEAGVVGMQSIQPHPGVARITTVNRGVNFSVPNLRKVLLGGEK